MMDVKTVITVVLSVFVLGGCQSITPVASYDPMVPDGMSSICKGHNTRCREKCSSEGVKESACAVQPDGTVQVICVCRGDSVPPPEKKP